MRIGLPKWLFNRQLGRTLGWIALIVFVAVVVNLVGIRLVGDANTWSRWLDEHAGYFLVWSGQFEYLERAKARLQLVVPVTLLIIFVLLYLNFRRVTETLIVMLSLPFSLVGGLWLMDWLGFDLSVAVAVGFIALAGVAAEFGVVMLIYLKQALEAREDGDVAAAVREGALLRVRPKAMTVAVILAGLFPVLVGGEVVRDDASLTVFYTSLALIIMGVGFLKPNISTIVGRLYTDNDPRTTTWSPSLGNAL